MPAPPFDIAQAHRWFAVEYNNEAWVLVELAQRTPEQVERMLLAAQASVVHWSAIGTPLNELRGLLLLATACIAAGKGEAAKGYADRSLALMEAWPQQSPRADAHAEGHAEVTAFDRASAYGAAARALALLGDPAAGAAQAAARGHAAAMPRL
jgi:hypothetical protein